MTGAAPFDISRFRPTKAEMDGSGKFSPNLYRWLKRKWGGRFSGRGLEHHPMVFRGGTDVFPGKPHDTLYIGRLADDGWFTGTRLMAVLCEGARKEVFAYSPRHVRRLGLKPVKNFWRDYARIGRCAIDRAHTKYFQSDDARWTVKGKTRTCNWCGNHKQRLHVHTKTKKVVVKTWRAA